MPPTGQPSTSALNAKVKTLEARVKQLEACCKNVEGLIKNFKKNPKNCYVCGCAGARTSEPRVAGGEVFARLGAD
jgi:hypothetical protein